mgnify:CR=1 FL=1
MSSTSSSSSKRKSVDDAGGTDDTDDGPSAKKQKLLAEQDSGSMPRPAAAAAVQEVENDADAGAQYHVDFNDATDSKKDERMIYKGCPFVAQTTSAGKKLNALFKDLHRLIPTSPIQFSPKGITMLAMDGSQAAIVYVHLRAKGDPKGSGFENYYCPDTFIHNFDMKTFADNFSDLASPDQTLTMCYEFNADSLKFKIDNPDTQSEDVYHQPLHQQDFKKFTLPKQSMPFRVKLPVSILSKALKKLGKRSADGLMRITADQDKFEFAVNKGKDHHQYKRATAGGGGGAQQPTRKKAAKAKKGSKAKSAKPGRLGVENEDQEDEDEKMSASSDDESEANQIKQVDILGATSNQITSASALFPIEYLKKFVLIMTKIKSTLTLSLVDEKTPMFIEQDISSDIGVIRYILAPSAKV